MDKKMKTDVMAGILADSFRARDGRKVNHVRSKIFGMTIRYPILSRSSMAALLEEIFQRF
jgi:hypothetical protein